MKPSVYFPGLNGIRFLAALAVMICHMEMTKHWFHEPNIYTVSFVGGVLGDIGVILFFVLSGFLITYLLLQEQKDAGTIRIKQFYIRRILRIWPLYYLVVLLGLFVLPLFNFFDVPGYSGQLQHHFLGKAFFFLSFLPNIPYAIWEHVPFAEQSWSVGVEEQYYLIWPVLMLFAVRARKTIHVMVGVILFYMFAKGLIMWWYADYPGGVVYNHLYQFWQHFNIDCMAIGGIAAYLLFYKKEPVLRFLFDPKVQVATYLILAYLTLRGIDVPFIGFEVYAVPFAVVILNLAANKDSLFQLEHPWLNYLGKISYGLYMFHNLVLVVVLKVIHNYLKLDFHSATTEILYYTTSVFLTIVVASVSYHFFEKRFLRAKLRYSTVVSGDNVPVGSAAENSLAAVPVAK